MNQPEHDLPQHDTHLPTDNLRPRIRALADDSPLGSYPPPVAVSDYQQVPVAAAVAPSYANAPAPSLAPPPATAGALSATAPPQYLAGPAVPPPLDAPPPTLPVRAAATVHNPTVHTPTVHTPTATPPIAHSESYPATAQFLAAPLPAPLLSEPPVELPAPTRAEPSSTITVTPPLLPPVAELPPITVLTEPVAPAPAPSPTVQLAPAVAPAMPASWSTPAMPASWSTTPKPGSLATPPTVDEIEWSPKTSVFDLETEVEDDAPAEKGFWSEDDSADANPQAPLATADRELINALHEVLLSGASDLHVTVNAPPMIRVDGGLRAIADSVVWDRPRVSSALRSILNPLQRENFERELELDFAYTISANARFRVNIYQQRGSMGAAFRLIPTEIKALADLGVPDAVSRFATLARGLVLVTGPTGSGKSTTLAALVDLVNRTRADHIVTVEDPIEFLHQNHKSLVNQREVGPDTHSFGAALKHVLRQDPDVILIGELRDLETISVALTAAETGHLVFATLHTQDAAQTIDRVIDVFPPHQQGQVRSQLAAVLQGVVCQTLVKRASGKGRVVATEVLVMTPAVANLIREGKTYQIPSALQAGRELGMYTMDQHLAELVDAGQITHQAATEKAHDGEGLKRLIHRADPGAGGPGNSMASSGIDFGDGTSTTASI